MIEFFRADKNKFAVFHTLYTDTNIFARFDWNERIESAKNCVSDSGYFIYNDSAILGGFSLKGNNVNYPFLVPPFCNKVMFWDIVIQYSLKECKQNELFFHEMPMTDMSILTKIFGAEIRWSKKIMQRPTESCTYNLDDGFCLNRLSKADENEIIEVIFQAHSNGYTSTVWTTEIGEIKEAVERRFDLFTQTDTLHMSNIVKDKASQKIVGVCIAGIYPDSPNNFATIHQVSVRPEYQRKGIAKAMMLKAISDASFISPVMTLGVLEGNPAEALYHAIGFSAGPSRFDALLSKSSS